MPVDVRKLLFHLPENSLFKNIKDKTQFYFHTSFLFYFQGKINRKAELTIERRRYVCIPLYLRSYGKTFSFNQTGPCFFCNLPPRKFSKWWKDGFDWSCFLLVSTQNLCACLSYASLYFISGDRNFTNDKRWLVFLYLVNILHYCVCKFGLILLF